MGEQSFFESRWLSTGEPFKFFNAASKHGEVRMGKMVPGGSAMSCAAATEIVETPREDQRLQSALASGAELVISGLVKKL